MRPITLVIVQLVISLAVVGVLLPGVIVNVPAARDPTVGLGVAAAIAIAAFVVLRIAWPRPRRH